MNLQDERNKLTILDKRTKNLADQYTSLNGKPGFEEAGDLYYETLNEWRAQNKLVRELELKERKQSATEIGKTQEAIEMEEKRAIKEANVTSATYERARKRLTNSVDGFVSRLR